MKRYLHPMLALASALLMLSAAAPGQQSGQYDQDRPSMRSTQDTVQGSSGRFSDKDTLNEKSGKAYEPDNTGVNKRDRDDKEITADEQGQSAADIELTRKIRRAIRDDDALSTYARNIKIITKDGVVTLRGPVRSAQERSAIALKASQVAGREKIRNRLEVKPAQGDSREDKSEHRIDKSSDSERD